MSAIDVGKVANWPKWMVTTTVILGAGWGARIAFTHELEAQETRCIAAIQASEARSKEQISALKEDQKEMRGDLRQLLIELRSSR
jgi:hypothetical protein